jgi:hypothetical protein
MATGRLPSEPLAPLTAATKVVAAAVVEQRLGEPLHRPAAYGSRSLRLGRHIEYQELVLSVLGAPASRRLTQAKAEPSSPQSAGHAAPVAIHSRARARNSSRDTGGGRLLFPETSIPGDQAH